MAKAVNYTINLSTDAGLAALKTYAQKLEAIDPKKAADAHDTLADAVHEKAKAERRAKLLTTASKTAGTPVTQAQMDNAQGTSRESADAEEDTEDLAVNVPSPPREPSWASLHDGLLEQSEVYSPVAIEPFTDTAAKLSQMQVEAGLADERRNHNPGAVTARNRGRHPGAN